MDAYPEYEGEPDVVFTVHWSMGATDGTYQSSAYGSIGITIAEGSTLTPYADLTEEQVIGWVHSAMGAEQVTACETAAANNIASQINPTVVTPAIPWRS